MGCNTGLVGARGWCPAEVISNSQRVMAVGLKGWAYFSRNSGRYEEQSAGDLELYLAAYRRFRNGPTGDGRLIPAAVFNATPELTGTTSTTEVSFRSTQIFDYIESMNSQQSLFLRHLLRQFRRHGIRNASEATTTESFHSGRFSFVGITYPSDEIDSLYHVSVQVEYQGNQITVDRVPEAAARSMFDAAKAGKEFVLQWWPADDNSPSAINQFSSVAVASH